MGVIRLGGAPIGNLYAELSEEAVAGCLQRAYELGIRAIDTAPLYGFGLSEQRIGRFLEALRDRGADPLSISTKVGRSLVDAVPQEGLRHGFAGAFRRDAVFDYSRAAVLAGFEQSLSHLGVNSVDILFIHDVGGLVHGADWPALREIVIVETLPTLRQLKNEGRCRKIGIGVNEIAVAADLIETGALDVLMLAGRYTLLEQGALGLLDRCAKLGVAVLAAGVFNSGVLAGGGHYNYAATSATIRDRVDRLEAVCARFDVPLGAAALRFPLAHPAVCEVVPGMGSRDHVSQSIEWAGWSIPRALWDALREECLIEPGAPIPC